MIAGFNYQAPFPSAYGYNNRYTPCVPQWLDYASQYQQCKKEASRRAAQKWRDSKQEKLNKLEIENTKLRKDLYEMIFECKKEKIESNLLLKELQFFQSMFAAIVQHDSTLIIKHEY